MSNTVYSSARGSAAALILFVALSAVAHAADLSVKFGVLNDRSGPYADLAGAGSVVAAQMAAEDFMAENKGIKVEVLSADHQNKPDIGSSIVRQWIDRDGVDVILDVPLSSVALGVHQIVREKNKLMINSGAGASELTGALCSPNTIHWTYDTWALANGTGGALVRSGGDTWFFITSDYAFGRALERDVSDVVVKSGGKVLGSVGIRSPRPTTRPFCSRLRPRARRSLVSPTLGAIRSTRLSRRPNSESPRPARSSPVFSFSSATSTRSASRRHRVSSSRKLSTGI